MLFSQSLFSFFLFVTVWSGVQWWAGWVAWWEQDDGSSLLRLPAWLNCICYLYIYLHTCVWKIEKKYCTLETHSQVQTNESTNIDAISKIVLRVASGLFYFFMFMFRGCNSKLRGLTSLLFLYLVNPCVINAKWGEPNR